MMPRLTIGIAWFDLWVGAYWDRRARALYVCPLPCVVLRIDFTPRLDQLEHAVDEREAAYQREVFDALPAADQALIRGVEADLSARNAALFRENVDLKRRLREACAMHEPKQLRGLPEEGAR